VRYEESFGRFGFGTEIRIAERVDITAAPLLRHSPHVLYTNVVEALLRFLLASKDRMLLHSACLRIGDRGVLVSARTDTGKTGTVLRLVRDAGALFLSDDMTIVEPDGLALCFPKPLTISSHTLRALDVSELRRRESGWLHIQSRLHSKRGRAIGTLLGKLNVPIMSVNALTQIVVPPPKFSVDRLVLADLTRCTAIDDVFVIERGHERLEPITAEQLVDELIANTDDAYRFPPFADVAPSIVIGAEGYAELCRREREILRRAIVGVPATRVGSTRFGWPDTIAAVVAERAAGAQPGDLPPEGIPVQRTGRADRRTGLDRRSAVRRPSAELPWQA
jgi:hypothetical protein